MSREVAFNLALSRIERIGYHKCCTAFDLVGAPLCSSPTLVGRSSEGGTASRPARIASMYRHPCELTAAQKKKQDENRQYRHRKRLQQMALALETES